MTIDEAIEELTKQLGSKYSTPGTPFHNAMKLGSEALKFVRDWRKDTFHPERPLLQGETKN